LANNNFDNFKKQLEELLRKKLEESKKALYIEALKIMAVSIMRTPVDTGALRASHSVSRPETNGDDTSVTISVGGPSAPYAIYVHENLEAHHPVGQAKFLESAILEARGEIGQNIIMRINSVLG
jgi:hypothetical protein